MKGVGRRKGRCWVMAGIAATIISVFGTMPWRATAQNAGGEEHAGQAQIRTVFEKAQQHEQRIRSGRIVLSLVEEHTPPSERELRARIKDPDELQVMLRIAKDGPTRTLRKETVVFENDRNRLLVKATQDAGPVSYFHVLFTDALRKTSSKFRRITKEGTADQREQVLVDKPIWPPYFPYYVLRGRPWSGRIKAIETKGTVAKLLDDDPATDQMVLLLVGGPGSQSDQKVWVDRRRGCTMSRVQLLDKKAGRLQGEERHYYRRYRDGFWYPERLIATYYGYDAEDKQYVSRRQTYVIRRAELNLALPEKAFAFEIPRGSVVQDNRVQPPLVYREGITSPAPAAQQERQRNQTELIGQAAPDFELPSVTGEKLRRGDLRGKVVLVNLYAYW